MAIIGVVSVFLGWLLYFASLKAMVAGSVRVDWVLWSRGVGACGLLLANGAMFFVQLQHGEPDWLVTFTLWPIFVLPLDAGYRSVCSQAKTSSEDVHDEN
ncbi:MAG: hypothetical protein HLX50_01505 [Alteromonadaceae bacterium]|nr:hypothetical protein [Alteromonadaceae bacterium]